MKLRENGMVDGQMAKFSTMADLLERQGDAYVRGYCRGAVAVMRQIDASGYLAERVRYALRLHLAEHPEILAEVERDWGVW